MIFSLCGFCFLRHYSDGKVNVAYFDEDEFIGNYVDTRINNGLGGDKAEVFYTKVLQQYPFVEYPGEKFMPEDAAGFAVAAFRDGAAGSQIRSRQVVDLLLIWAFTL